MADIKELVDKLYNIQITYVGNKFEDVATQEMLQNLVTQVNLLQSIVKLMVNAK